MGAAPAADDESPARSGNVRPIIADALTAGREWLTAAEARRILDAFGIPVIRGAQAATADDAVRAAESLGWPVALKIQSQDIVHKSDLGGVVLDIATPDALRKAAEAMLASVRALRPEARIDGFSFFQIYRYIALPLSRPVISAIAILQFLEIWNSYLWPIMVTRGVEYRPLSVAMSAYFFRTQAYWGYIMAFAVSMVVPAVVFFLILQRQFIASVMSSGVKG